MGALLASARALWPSILFLIFATSALGSLDFNADYRLDNATVSACFNSTVSACACMNTRPAPLGSPDQRRIITDLECWDCQSKMCMQRTCRRTFTVPYCDLYVGCVRLCLCRCPGTRYGRSGRSFVYIPCNQWCDGTPDCPFGLDEPKGVYCAKRSYWFTIMPLSTIGLVVLFLFLCRQSIAKTINTFTRRTMGRNMFVHDPDRVALSSRLSAPDQQSLTVRHPAGATTMGMTMQSLADSPSNELPPYPYDLPPPGPRPPDPIDNLPPPPSYESVIGEGEGECARARLNKP